MDYRAALVDFYRKHNPLKLVEVDALLRKYKGREEELLHALRVKYKVNEQQQQESPPAPPPPPPPPPPPNEEPVFEQEVIKDEPPKTEPVRPRYSDTEITRVADDYKGRTAAERAEYWKKELERRETERETRKRAERDTESSSARPRAERMKVVRQKAVEAEAEPAAEENKSKVLLIICIVLAVLLTVFVAVMLVNTNIRNTIFSEFGLKTNGAPPEEATKKEGIEPGGLSSEKPAKSGDFALEEDEPGDKAPSVEDALNEKSTTANTPPKKQPPTDTQKNTTPPSSDEVVRRKFYIGCAAVGTEEMAKNRVDELKRKGFDNAKYFYIPDYEPGGKNLYRIVVGPYDKEDEALEMAVNVRAESPSAYHFFLK